MPHKDRLPVDYVMNGHQYQLPDGAVVVPITSCTSTSNHKCSTMAAGLLAKAIPALWAWQRQPVWVKASLTGFESRF